MKETLRTSNSYNRSQGYEQRDSVLNSNVRATMAKITANMVGLTSPTSEDQEKERGVEALVKKFDQDKIRAHERAESIVNMESFDIEPTKEVFKALEDYHSDHNRFLTLIEGVIDGQVPLGDGEIDTSIAASSEIYQSAQGENQDINFAIQRIMGQPTRHEQMLTAFSEMSFAFDECALGTMTLNKGDSDRLSDVYNKFFAEGLKEGILGKDPGKNNIWINSTKSSISSGKNIQDSLYGHKIKGLANRYDDKPAGQVYSYGDLQKIEKYHFQKIANIIEENRVGWDMRPAGQLLFHNSPQINKSIARWNEDGELINHGSIKTRADQKKTFGEYVSSTERGERSNSIHFSEYYLKGQYMSWMESASDPTTPLEHNEKQIYREEGNNELLVQPGTIAIPIAEVVKQLPIGGADVQYGIVKARNKEKTTSESLFKTREVLDTDPRSKTWSGSYVMEDKMLGSVDEIKSAAKTDRVFFNQSEDRDQAKYSSLNLNDKNGYPKEIVIFSEQNIKDSGFRKIPHDISVLHKDADYNAGIFGFGEKNPQSVVIRDGCEDAVIAKLEQKSMEKYKDQLVVPLRSGVLKFLHEDIKQDATINKQPKIRRDKKM